MNRFSKVCLMVIALSLAIIALRPIVSPQPARAANHYKYLFERINWQPESIQDELNKRGAEGWELYASYNSGSGPSVDLIFRQEAR
jgi:hypothetical protein